MRALKRCCALLLLVHLVTFVQCNDCTLQSFKESNHFHEGFELSNLRQRYSSGDTVRVPCKMGYRGFFKITCSEGRWVPHGQRCEVISCGHPGDAQFADFKLVKGSDYTFGSQVLYTCQKGYQMTSFKSTRNCMQGGWDGHLPECEAIKCAPISVQDNVQVNGDIYEPTFGNVLQFSCKERSEVLLGEMELFCDENGKWNNEPPTCKEISCEKPLIDNGNAQGDKQQFKENEVLRYSCNLRYKKVDGRPSVCRKLGLTAQWIPRPECEPLTCKLSYNPPGTTTYDPQDQTVFRPGQTVRVSCGEKEWVKSTELRSAQIECQHTGLWDFPPECQLFRCFRHAEHVYQWERSWNDVIEIGGRLWYWCENGYERTTDSRAVCTRQGWQPDPLCKAKPCTTPVLDNAEMVDRRKQTYSNGEEVRFRCSGETNTFSVTCHFGKWISPKQCEAKPCTTPPVLDNAEMVNRRKQTYSNGEGVRFRCSGETNTFSVTCQSGKWISPKQCEAKPCTTPPVLDNAEMVDRRKQTYSNGEGVRFRCKDETEITVTCHIGEWIFPKQCEDSPLDVLAGDGSKNSERSQQSQCGGPAIPNGFSYLVDSKLYYACSEGYKLQKAGWWDEATCVNGQWNKVKCIAITDCGPIPAIPHMTETSENSRFSEGHTIPIRCESGYRNLHVGLESITCKQGKWDSNRVDFKTICTPIEKKCGPPARVKNAVILAPFQKEYLSNTLLTYKCRYNYTIEGEDTVRCINGTWDKTISCKDPRGCGPAPLLENGDTLSVSNTKFAHNARVEYQCKSVYIMEGGPFKTCLNGEWTGEIECLTQSEVGDQIQ